MTPLVITVESSIPVGVTLPAYRASRPVRHTFFYRLTHWSYTA